MSLRLRDHLVGDVSFVRYRAGHLYYQTQTGVEFAVPIADTQDATFPNRDKALLFMRWIRKHFEALALERTPPEDDRAALAQTEAHPS